MVEVTSFCPGGCQAEFEYTIDPAGEYSFTSTSGALGEIVDYQWSTLGEDAGNGEQINIFIEDQDVGQEVCLTIFTDDDCEDTYCALVTGNPCGTPFITVAESFDSGSIFVEVEPGEVNSYDWFLYDAAGDLLSIGGGGGPFGGNDPFWEFTGGGGPGGGFEIEDCTSYFVSVIADCGFDGESNETEKVEVVGFCPGGCQAAFEYEPAPGAEYIFDGSSSAAIGEIVSYTWLLEGEELLTAPVPALGSPEEDVLGLELCLTITTDDDCTDTFCTIVTDNPCATPVIAYAESVGPGFIEVEVEPQDVQSFTWNLYSESGELLTSESPGGPFGGGDDPFYFFDGGGGYEILDCQTYLVTVQADCGPDGESYESPQTAVVANCPSGCTASFEVEGVSEGLWQAVSNAASVGEIVSYEWTLNGEVVSNDPNPEISGDPLAGGELCLTIETDDDCVETSCGPLPISGCPQPQMLGITVNDDGSIDVELDIGDAFGARGVVYNASGDEIGDAFVGGPGGPSGPLMIPNLPECENLTLELQSFCNNGEGSFIAGPFPFVSYCEGCNAEFTFEPSGPEGEFIWISTSTAQGEIISWTWTVDGAEIAQGPDAFFPVVLGSQPEVCLDIVTDDGCESSSCLTLTYCESSSEGSSEYIANVSLLAIDNDSGNDDGYADFSNIETFIGLGQTGQISCTPGFDNQEYSEGFSVYIDYNQNLSFGEPNELVFVSEPSTETAIGNFVVPNDALLGATRMRVVMSFNGGNGESCGIYPYGETEDYTVVITADPQSFCSASFELTVESDLISAVSSSISTSDIISFDWQVNGESVSGQEEFGFSPSAGIDYEICLAIETADGCSDAVCQNVSNNCLAEFSFEVDGLLVQLTNESQGYDEFLWDFGNGDSNSFVESPSYEFVQPGNYTICLEIINLSGCEDVICQDVTVQDVNCEAPQDLQLLETTETSLSFEWGAADEAFEYNYLLYIASPFSTIESGFTNETSISFTGLAECTAYNLVIESVCPTATVPVELAGVLTSCTGANDCEASYTFDGQNSFTSNSNAGADAEITNYIWLKDGENVGSGFADILIDMEAGESAEICLTILTSAGCSDTYCGSVVDIAETNAVVVQQFPNPADEQISFVFEGVKRPASLRIFDITGRQLMQQDVLPGADMLQLYTGDWSNGTYVYQLQDQDRSLLKVERFIISH